MIMGTTETKIKIYCAGEGQQQFSQPSKVVNCGHEELPDSRQSVLT
jgi:hypothetical protein